MKMLMIRLTALAALLLLLPGALAARAEEGSARPLPSILLFSQHTDLTRINQNAQDRRTYPDSENTAVNSAVSDAVNTLAQRMLALAPDQKTDAGDAYVDTGATVTVTGTKLASFFVLSHVLFDRRQIAVDFDALVFDMESGERITLEKILTDEAEPYLKTFVNNALTAYFPAETPDAGKLDALCRDLMSAPFTLTPAYLVFHFRADALYPDKTTLMHARVPYSEILRWMTPFGKEQTDNSGYLTAAVTFDDGPGRGVTQKILMTLREHCAVGTFFNLGKLLRTSEDAVAWEHDAGHSVQSHTYNHDYNSFSEDVMIHFRDRFALEQEAMIGVAPSYMRAPGGNDKLYCRYGVSMPIIRWNCLTGDAGAKVSIAECRSTFIYTLKEHSVILMHNVRWSSVDVAQEVLSILRERGYLMVTVDELFALRGVSMENNTVYFGNE